MKTTKHNIVFISISILYTTLLILVVMLLVGFRPVTKQVPLEHVYTQTDRPFYFPGETIWFKSYVVSQAHTISTLSDVLNAELVAPNGAVVKTIKVSIKNGYAYGDFTIDPKWVGGIYTLSVYTNWMRNFGEGAFFTKKITIQKVVKPNVLFDLKFEKEGYGKGAMVKANFEVKNLKNRGLKGKKLAFKVTVKGKPIVAKHTITDINGKALIQFVLPETLSTTDVVLNVLMPYQGTTESISKPVPVVFGVLDVQFFPESGKLIAGTSNCIAFKALDEFGKPVDITGELINEKGRVISVFSSYHNGMGSVTIPVKNHQKYYARIKTPFLSKTPIALPKVHAKGTRFSVTTDRLKTTLKLFSTATQKLVLKVTHGSKILYEKPIESSQTDIDLHTEKFPIGISKFSIINMSTRTIEAERLVFLNAHKQLQVSIALDKPVYKTREKVKATIRTTDGFGNPIPANLSVAIADHKLLSFADDKQDHILSYLLLSSELKGRLYKPSFYFNPQENKAAKALDYVMLTHGWRAYIDKSNLTFSNAHFKPERNNVHSGKVVNRQGEPRKAKLLLFNENDTNVLVFETDSVGAFQFEMPDTQQAVLIAYTEAKEELNIIKYTHSAHNAVNALERGRLKNNGISKLFEKPLGGVIKKKAKANIILSEDASSLGEVVVVGYTGASREKTSGSITTVRSEQIDILKSVQGRLSGVHINNDYGLGPNFNIAIRGSAITSGTQPLYVIDGVVADRKAFSGIPPNQIKSIEVLRDAAETAIYGYSGYNGVIVIHTASNYFSNYRKKVLNHKAYKNYSMTTFYSRDYLKRYQSQLFYAPIYDSNAIVDERTDFRQTIYWNPVIETDANGVAEVEFYNSDAITSFKITAEGIGYNGLLGRTEKLYSTNQLLNLDFKMPNYMALNDTIVLPITINNEKKNAVAVELNLELPEHLKLLEAYTPKFTVAADTTLLKSIKIMPIKKGDNVTLKASITSAAGNDTVKRKATVLSPYFPIETTISGTDSQAFSFDINAMVPQSLKAKFSIYTDVVGSVMDGIEGLIRKPYGCFEQTSSTTYPNIMVLQYLKETGKSSPEIKAKAMAFIKDGYERLVSFETKEGGFEWFGSTPPHETLTAYGILEFTEMQQVYAGVEQQMIDRTVKWLLDRKDGKGGFKKSKKGYDSFSSSPTDVANAYIVYALSEAKIKTDLNLEYSTAYSHAIKSKDSYKMALMALASDNLNKSKNTKAVLDVIKTNIETYGLGNLPVSATITRSYGNAKHIETAALTLLALMRDYTNNRDMITKGIAYLVKQRKHNRFGATQSTAMALKALIHYTKNEKQNIIQQTDTVTLAINGNVLQQKLKVNKEGTITIDELSHYFKEGKQIVDVLFSNPESTFPYALDISWDSPVPSSSKLCPLALKTEITKQDYNVGDNVSMTVQIKSLSATKLGMVTAIIGVPSGTTLQTWQLKLLVETHKVAYYELFDNYLVLYWRAFDVSEEKTLHLDLKADIAGYYKAPASTAYLYYGDDYKTWISGCVLRVGIEEKTEIFER